MPFNSTQKFKRARRKSNAAALKADTATCRYLASIDVKQDKGLRRFTGENAALALINREFLVESLPEHNLVKCPQCCGGVEVTFLSSYHGLVLHAGCKKYFNGMVDVCDTTRAKTEAGNLSVEALKKMIDVGKKYYEVCDYNET